MESNITGPGSAAASMRRRRALNARTEKGKGIISEQNDYEGIWTAERGWNSGIPILRGPGSAATSMRRRALSASTEKGKGIISELGVNLEFGVWSFVLFNDAWSQKGHLVSNMTVILASSYLL